MSAFFSVIAGFFRWWSDELRSLLPRAARDWLAGLPPRWEIDATGIGSQGRRRRATSSPADLQDLPELLDHPSIPRGRFVDITLPAQSALIRTHRLPRSARAKLGEILSLDLRRSTPLDPSDLVWAHRIAGRFDRELLVEQVVLKRDALDLVVAKLARRDLHLGRVRVARAKDVITVLDGRNSRAALLGIWPKANLALATLVITLAVLAILGPQLARETELAERHARVDLLRQRTVAARTVVEMQQADQAGSVALLRHLVERPRVSEILRELTLSLPDKVWITDADITADRLRFSGFVDGSAAELAIGLKASTLFRDPELSGPVSIAAGSGAERFEISVGLSQQSP